MQLYQFEALSSGPRLGLASGTDVIALDDEADLISLSKDAMQGHGSFAAQVQARRTQQRFNLNELLLDGRVRPPLWPGRPDHIQLLRTSSAGWQSLCDGSGVCRPAMPLPHTDPLVPEPLLLLAAWVSPNGDALPLGITLGLLANSADGPKWSFGSGLLLDPTPWGQTVTLDYELSRLAAPVFEQSIAVDLPTNSEVLDLLGSLGATPAAFVLLDLSTRSLDMGATPERTGGQDMVQHGDGLKLSVAEFGMELRSLVHRED